MHGRTMGLMVLALTIFAGVPGCYRVVRADDPEVPIRSEAALEELRRPADWPAWMKRLPPVPEGMHQAPGFSRPRIDLQDAVTEAIIDGIRLLQVTRDVTVSVDANLKQRTKALLDRYHQEDPILRKETELDVTTRVKGRAARMQRVYVVALDVTRDQWGVGWVACALVRVHYSDVSAEPLGTSVPQPEGPARRMSEGRFHLPTAGIKLLKGDLWGRLDLQGEEGLVVAGNVWGVITCRRPGVEIRVKGDVYGTIEVPEGRVVVDGKAMGRIIQQNAE